MRRNVPLRAFFAVAAAVAFSGLLYLPDATARASFESPYSLDQTYQTALRFVRVDNGFKITEKDPQAAYVLFEYKNPEAGDRTSNGAIEIVPSQGTVKVVVQLANMPRYHEQVLADGLQKKLREDLGDPPRRPDPPPDAAVDAAAE